MKYLQVTKLRKSVENSILKLVYVIIVEQPEKEERKNEDCNMATTIDVCDRKQKPKLDCS